MMALFDFFFLWQYVNKMQTNISLGGKQEIITYDLHKFVWQHAIDALLIFINHEHKLIS